MSEALAESTTAYGESTDRELSQGPAPEDTLGAGIFAEVANSNEDDPADEEQPTTREDALADPADTKPTESINNESPEQQGLRQADYTRKTEQLAREREEFRSQQAEVEQMRTQLIQQQAQQAEILQRLTGQVEQQTAQPTTMDALRQQVDNAQTYEERQHAENTLRGYQHLQEQTQQVVQAALTKQREEILAAVKEQYGAPLQQFTESQNSQRVEFYRAQIDEVRAAYPGVVDQPDMVEFLHHNLGRLKNDDGSVMTLTQMVGMRTGLPAQQRQQARAEQRAQRFTAKGRVTPQGAQGANVNDGGGQLTRAEALAIIESNPYPGTAN